MDHPPRQRFGLGNLASSLQNILQSAGELLRDAELRK